MHFISNVLALAVSIGLVMTPSVGATQVFPAKDIAAVSDKVAVYRHGAKPEIDAFKNDHNDAEEVQAATHLARRAVIPLNYYGGPVMTSGVKVYLIFYGNHKQSTQSIVSNFVNGLGGSNWWGILQSYYDRNGNYIKRDVKLAGVWTDSYSQSTTITSVSSIVRRAISRNNVTPHSDAIYVVLASKDVTDNSGLCTNYCGYHTAYYSNGQLIKYALIGDPTRCPGGNGQPGCLQLNYRGTTKSINNDQSADGMINIMAHEIAETASDPDVSSGWMDANGDESCDKCNFKFLNVQNDSRGIAYNVNFSTGKFLIQSNWSVKSQMCVQGETPRSTPQKESTPETPKIAATKQQ